MEFKQIFKTPELENHLVEIITHGRVNLLGEHTDYNHGLVFPMHIPQTMRIIMAINEAEPAGSIRMFSSNECENESQNHNIVTRNINSSKELHWSDYVIGSLQIAQQKYDNQIPALDIFLESDIPAGAGVSSSSALEVGILKGIRELFNTSWSDLDIAKFARRAENEYVGMPCGLMDQMVISIGHESSGLFIDFNDIDEPYYEELQIFDREMYAFSVIFSGIQHKLVEGDEGYKTRREQCERAAKLLEVPHLSAIEATEIDRLKILDDEILYKRALHVVTENQRVRDALAALVSKNATQFGQCMIQSHVSQRDNYDVSVKEIDDIVDIALENNALGARLTGGGFGGSVVILSHLDTVQTIWQQVKKSFPKAQRLV